MVTIETRWRFHFSNFDFFRFTSHLSICRWRAAGQPQRALTTARLRSVLCGPHTRRVLLLQLRVLGLGLLQDWDVGVSVFPEREEVGFWSPSQVRCLRGG